MSGPTTSSSTARMAAGRFACCARSTSSPARRLPSGRAPAQLFGRARRPRRAEAGAGHAVSHPLRQWPGIRRLGGENIAGKPRREHRLHRAGQPVGERAMSRASTRSFEMSCSTGRSSTRSRKRRSGFTHGGATTTAPGRTPRSDGSHQLPRSALSRHSSGRVRARQSRWQPMPPSTNIQAGSVIGRWPRALV